MAYILGGYGCSMSEDEHEPLRGLTVISIESKKVTNTTGKLL